MPTLSDLFESVRPGLLYHGTGPDIAARILHTNVLLGRTDANAILYHTVDDGNTVSTRAGDPGFRRREVNKFDRVAGVSLTRDPNFARRWTSGQGVVLVFDSARLRQNHRLVPYNYYGGRQESEEFLVGDLKNLSRYLVAIDIAKATYDELVEEDEVYEPGDGQYHALLVHPLLRVNGHRWDAMSGRVSKAA